MTELVVAHTADLAPELLSGAEELLWETFDDLTPDDWEHSLGGMHAVVVQDGAVLGHAALVQRRLVHRGVALRAGYVEAVAVRAGHRRRGLGGTLMAPLERIARAAYDLAALGATDDGAALYLARGWQRWRGATWALTLAGTVRTADDDGGVFVLQCGVDLDLDGDLTADHRDGDSW